MIDRPPGQGPVPSSQPEPQLQPPPVASPSPASPPADSPPPAVTPPPRRGLHIGPVPITPALVLVAIALIGSIAYVLYVVTQVEDEQIQLLGYGFGVMGASFAAIAIGALVSIWRAASRARAGRALILAIVGGVAGLCAIGCFTFTALSLLVGKG